MHRHGRLEGPRDIVIVRHTHLLEDITCMHNMHNMRRSMHEICTLLAAEINNRVKNSDLFFVLCGK